MASVLEAASVSNEVMISMSVQSANPTVGWSIHNGNSSGEAALAKSEIKQEHEKFLLPPWLALM